MPVLCVSLPLLLAVLPLNCPGQEVLANALEPAGIALRTMPGPGSGPGSGAIRAVPARAAPVEREKMSAYDWSLLGAAAALRFLDYRTTVQFTEDPADFREVELPRALVRSRAALGAFEASTVVVNYFAYRSLVGHHHRKMAQVGQSIYIGVMAGTVAWNYDQLNQR
jgi:hypothetical protein